MTAALKCGILYQLTYPTWKFFLSQNPRTLRTHVAKLRAQSRCKNSDSGLSPAIDLKSESKSDEGAYLSPELSVE